MKNQIPDSGIRKNVLLRTNLVVCAVIMLGFIITTWIGYETNQKIFRREIQSVTELTSDGIYHEIDSIFSKPINISLTMGNDNLLKNFLKTEQSTSDYDEFLRIMRDYLNTYHMIYQYDSVFLVSANTNRYYNFDGFDRILEEGDPENTWFFDFMEQTEAYRVVIDNDQAEGADNEVTVFINCRITGSNGVTMGAVGVGLRVDSLQQLLKQYEDEYGVLACLADRDGNVEISANRTRFEGEANFFSQCSYPELKEQLYLNAEKGKAPVWYSSEDFSGYVRNQYIQNLNWYLIVENETTQLNQTLASRTYRNFVIFFFVILIVLYTITRVIKKYNARIIELTISAEQEHRTVYQEAAEQLYENIYEVDVTHNRAANENTALYFEGLGVPADIPFDKALHVIAQKQIKEEYRQGYINTLLPENVIRKYEDGIENLRFDFMITNDGIHYDWKRIIAHLFFWSEDESLRMLIYREDINPQMKRELYLHDQMKKDSLTGLLNKAATQDGIQDFLIKQPGTQFAFLILDIDNFKGVNDNLGHAAGDMVLGEFAKILKSQFRGRDIVGRIGGDEFVAFITITDEQTARNKAKAVTEAIHQPIIVEGRTLRLSSSIGVSLFPQDARDFAELYKKADNALYMAKKKGKDIFVLYQDIP